MDETDAGTALGDLRRIASWLADDTGNDNAQGAACDLIAAADYFGSRQYAVLVDVGTDWPEVVFVGTFEEAAEVDRELDDRDIPTSIQAVVTPEEALAEAQS